MEKNQENKVEEKPQDPGQAPQQEQQEEQRVMEYHIEVEPKPRSNVTNASNLQVLIYQAGHKSGLQFNLHNQEKARKLVLKAILEHHRKQEDKEAQISISSTSTSISNVVQALTELQHENRIQIVSAKNHTDKGTLKVVFQVTVTKSSE